MDIVIQSRAEIALRSLKQSERKQILQALERIKLVKPQDLWQIPHLYKLREKSDQNFYVYRGNQQLRLVLSFQENICTVEDIMAHDKLNKLVGNYGR